MPEIEVQEVAKSYGRRAALRGVSFRVRSNEFFCLLAPPGSGKTTMLRLIAGLERPDRGGVFIDGHPLIDLPPGDRGIAMVFEDLALYPHMSGFNNIAHPLRRRGVPPDVIRRRVDEVADVLGVRHVLGRLPHTFSGGEQQRVAIARAIVREPKILLLDQPLSSLDAKVRETMRGELRHLQERTQQTTIYATADYEEALALADRILVLREGSSEQIGTPEEVYHSPATTFAAAITGSPPMNLIQCVVQNGVAVAKDLAIDVTGIEGPGVVGLRPEQLRFGAGPEGVVDLVQSLGRKKIVDVVLGGVRIKVVTGTEFTASRGTRVSLAMDPASARIYDAEGHLTYARAAGTWRLLR